MKLILSFTKWLLTTIGTKKHSCLIQILTKVSVANNQLYLLIQIFEKTSSIDHPCGIKIAYTYLYRVNLDFKRTVSNVLTSMYNNIFRYSFIEKIEKNN